VASDEVAAGGGFWSWLTGCLRPLAVHPGFAAATGLVLIGGVAGALYLRGVTGKQSMDEARATAAAASPAVESTAASLPARGMPGAGAPAAPSLEENGLRKDPLQLPPKGGAVTISPDGEGPSGANRGGLDLNAQQSPDLRHGNAPRARLAEPGEVPALGAEQQETDKQLGSREAEAGRGDVLAQQSEVRRDETKAKKERRAPGTATEAAPGAPAPAPPTDAPSGSGGGAYGRQPEDRAVGGKTMSDEVGAASGEGAVAGPTAQTPNAGAAPPPPKSPSAVGSTTGGSPSPAPVAVPKRATPPPAEPKKKDSSGDRSGRAPSSADRGGAGADDGGVDASSSPKSADKSANETPAATEKEARRLHGQARAKAGGGDCAGALSLRQRIYRVDPTYYSNKVKNDPELTRCANEAKRARPMDAEEKAPAAPATPSKPADAK
jgi:hypothetical protein